MLRSIEVSAQGDADAILSDPFRIQVSEDKMKFPDVFRDKTVGVVLAAFCAHRGLEPAAHGLILSQSVYEGVIPNCLRLNIIDVPKDGVMRFTCVPADTGERDSFPSGRIYDFALGFGSVGVLDSTYWTEERGISAMKIYTVNWSHYPLLSFKSPVPVVAEVSVEGIPEFEKKKRHLIRVNLDTAAVDNIPCSLFLGRGVVYPGPPRLGYFVRVDAFFTLEMDPPFTIRKLEIKGPEVTGVGNPSLQGDRLLFGCSLNSLCAYDIVREQMLDLSFEYGQQDRAWLTSIRPLDDDWMVVCVYSREQSFFIYVYSVDTHVRFFLGSVGRKHSGFNTFFTRDGLLLATPLRDSSRVTVFDLSLYGIFPSENLVRFLDKSYFVGSLVPPLFNGCLVRSTGDQLFGSFSSSLKLCSGKHLRPLQAAMSRMGTMLSGGNVLVDEREEEEYVIEDVGAQRRRKTAQKSLPPTTRAGGDVPQPRSTTQHTSSTGTLNPSPPRDPRTGQLPEPAEPLVAVSETESLVSVTGHLSEYLVE